MFSIKLKLLKSSSIGFNACIAGVDQTVSILDLTVHMTATSTENQILFKYKTTHFLQKQKENKYQPLGLLCLRYKQMRQKIFMAMSMMSAFF